MLLCLYRIRYIFGEGKGSCTGGGPGVNRAHPDEIEFLSGTGEPASCFVDVKLDTRQIGQVTVVEEAMLEKVYENWVQFHPGHIEKAKRIRGEQVATSTDSDDCRTTAVAYPERKISDVIGNPRP
jgi:hypothetical protein